MDTLQDILDDKGCEVHVIEPDATVLEAVDRMCCAHIGALLVMDAQTLVGIFSERDLLRRVVLARRDPALTRVGDVTTLDVRCVRPDASAHDAMDLMTTHRVRHLPVVDGRRVLAWCPSAISYAGPCANGSRRSSSCRTTSPGDTRVERARRDVVGSSCSRGRRSCRVVAALNRGAIAPRW